MHRHEARAQPGERAMPGKIAACIGMVGFVSSLDSWTLQEGPFEMPPPEGATNRQIGRISQ